MTDYTGVAAVVTGIGFAALAGVLIGGLGTAAAGAASRRKTRRRAREKVQALQPMLIEKRRAPGLVDRLLRRPSQSSASVALTDAQLEELEVIARDANENDRGHGAPLTNEQARLGINSEAVLLLVTEVRRARTGESN